MYDNNKSLDLIEKISTAVQDIQNCLQCAICLELVKQPVVIKCNHQFCKICITKAASQKEDAKCPICLKKINKRSIPKNSNLCLELCIQKYQNLKNAIKKDSGIDALEYYKKSKHTKESAPYTNNKSTDIASNKVSSKNDVSKKFKKSKILSQRKEVTESGSQEHFINPKSKVETWLETVPVSSSIIENEIAYDNNSDTEMLATNLCNNSSSSDKEEFSPKSLKKTNKINLIKINKRTKKSLHTKNFEEPIEDIKQNLREHDFSDKEEFSQESKKKVRKSSEPKDDSKVIKTMNKKEKQADKLSLTSQSNNDHWKRVKKVGKEMKVNTLKKLHVSIENVHPSSLTETITSQTQSTENNLTKNDKENKLSFSKSQKNTLTKKRKSQSFGERIALNDETNDFIEDDSLLERSNKANISMGNLDENKINNIIGLTSSHNQNDLKNVASIDEESNTVLINPTPNEEFQRTESFNKQNNTTSLKEIKAMSEEKPKSRLSLRSHSAKSNVSQNSNLTHKSISQSSNDKNILVVFKKLGKVCKKYRKVPFYYRGSTRSPNSTKPSKTKERLINDIFFLKKNPPAQTKEVNLLSPEKDSQLHLLSVTPRRSKEKSKKSTIEISEKNVSLTLQNDQSSEFNKTLDKSSNLTNKSSKRQLIFHKPDEPNTITNPLSPPVLNNMNSQHEINKFDPKQQEVNDDEEKTVRNEVQNKNSDSDIETVLAAHCSKNDFNMQKSVTEQIKNVKNYDVMKQIHIDSDNLSTESLTDVKKILPGRSKNNSKLSNKIIFSDSSSIHSSPVKKKKVSSLPTDSDSEEGTKSIIKKWRKNEQETVNSKKRKRRSKNLSSLKRRSKETVYINESSSEESDSTLKNESSQITGQKKSNETSLEKNKTNVEAKNLSINMPIIEDFDESANTNSINVIASSYTHLPKTIANIGSMRSLINKSSDKETKNLKEVKSLEKILPTSSTVNIETCTKACTEENQESEDLIGKTVFEETLQKNEMSPVAESLMNITQEQLNLKRVEKDLFGFDISEIRNGRNNKEEEIMVSQSLERNDMETPKRRKKIAVNTLEKNTENDETESIGVTPTTKKRRSAFFIASPFQSQLSESQIPPTPNDVISAITPIKNRNSKPLHHSTPAVATSKVSENKKVKIKKLILACSGLTKEDTNYVQLFVKKFNAELRKDFDKDVTHVIVKTDSETNTAQKTFKYIQGIAYKKFVVNIRWVIDCLKSSSIVNEDKYEALDSPTLECGSKRSRNRDKDIFDGFAFFFVGDFPFSMDEFKKILIFNGAKVASEPEDLLLELGKIQVVLVGDTEKINDKDDLILARIARTNTCYEWIVDSLSQYKIKSLTTYLFDTTPGEASNLGVPDALLTEENEDETDVSQDKGE